MMSRISTLEQLRACIPEAPLSAAKIRNHLDDQALAFVETSPFLLLATRGEDGIEISPKGDAPGFVAIENPRSLLIPERAGNRLNLGLKNILADNRVGVMFMRPNTSELLRLTGRAELLSDPDLAVRFSARGREPVLIIRMLVERAFFQCARSILRAGLWNPEGWPPPMTVDFGRIYADALRDPAMAGLIREQTQAHNSEL